MPSSHLYPDPSNPDPTFMMGHFDLDCADRGSLLELGEAMLRVQRQDQPVIRAAPSHHQAGRAGEVSGSFLFGRLAEQPLIAFPDDLILNLWATEQA